MASLYFKTLKNTETGDKIKRIVGLAKTGKIEAEQLCKALGATDNYMVNSRYILGTGLVAFNFTSQPDKEIWKPFPKFPGYYVPKVKNPKGKEIINKMFELQKVDVDELSMTIGLNDFFKSPGFFEAENYYYFEIDSKWEHKMPTDCCEILGSEYEQIQTSRL